MLFYFLICWIRLMPNPEGDNSMHAFAEPVSVTVPFCTLMNSYFLLIFNMKCNGIIAAYSAVSSFFLRLLLITSAVPRMPMPSPPIPASAIYPALNAEAVADAPSAKAFSSPFQ